ARQEPRPPAERTSLSPERISQFYSGSPDGGSFGEPFTRRIPGVSSGPAAAVSAGYSGRRITLARSAERPAGVPAGTSAREATGEATAEMLTELFTVFGAPLVLKSDHGSAFGSEAVQALLARWGAFSLFSPPGCPRYNGAIEAAIGALKTRTA